MKSKIVFIVPVFVTIEIPLVAEMNSLEFSV